MPWIGGNNALNLEQMQNNAKMFQTKMKSLGCSDSFIAGMLGNIQSESTINPQRVETGGGGGYGLVQWTPASKLIDWCASQGLDYTDGDAQCLRIAWEKDNNQQWIATTPYPFSFAQAWISNDEPAVLASAFLYNYERPADPGATEQLRKDQANYWFGYLGGG